MSLWSISLDTYRVVTGNEPISKVSERGFRKASRDAAASAENGLGKAVAVIAKFVPTEIIAMYAAAIGIIIGDARDTHFLFYATHTVYFSFLTVTLILFFANYITQIQISGQRFRVSGTFFWRLCATGIAYLVWAAGVSPETAKQLLCIHVDRCIAVSKPQDFALVGMLIVSPVLAAIDQLFPAVAKAKN